jgi:hypothetical protein
MTWKPRKYKWLIEQVPVSCVGNSCLIGLGTLQPITARSTVTVMLEKTWRYLFAMPKGASLEVQGEYWSLLIQNGIVIQ